MRVSTLDQHPETQAYDLRQMRPRAATRSKARQPGLDQMLVDARKHRFDTVLMWSFDRLARSVRHFLEVLDEPNHLQIEFISFRENIDTGGPLGRAMVVIVSSIAELERSLIVERIRPACAAPVPKAATSAASRSRSIASASCTIAPA